MFGDQRDTDGAVSRVLKEKHVYVLRAELGTEPQVYYVGFEKGVH
jgi:Fe-S-cluster-containing dehydrogenase component